MNKGLDELNKVLMSTNINNEDFDDKNNTIKINREKFQQILRNKKKSSFIYEVRNIIEREKEITKYSIRNSILK